MSLFRKAGKKFEETKRGFLDDDGEFICQHCDEPVQDDYDHCPHCGEDAVVSMD